LPKAVHQRAAALWHLRDRLAWALNFGLRHGRPRTLLHFGIAPGDDLLCTAVLRELKKRGRKNIWMMSNHPELFLCNADATQVVPADHRFQDYTVLWGGKYQHLEYAAFDHDLDRSQPTSRHVIAELCARAGVTGEVILRPYLALSEKERVGAIWASGKIVIQNSGLNARFPMLNKQWYPERFQAVVDSLHREIEFVQIGSKNDPLLENTLDLRGKTSVRESAAILSQARLFVGIEGFLMHLARAMECPAVIVFGGRTAPWQFGYTCNVNLYSALSCAPCWLWNRCDYGRACMDMITVDHVTDGIKKQLEQPRENLMIDSTVI
jgi:hypothetical protein